jgi:hypothetical protein
VYFSLYSLLPHPFLSAFPSFSAFLSCSLYLTLFWCALSFPFDHICTFPYAV